jgi:hypothetical protein
VSAPAFASPLPRTALVALASAAAGGLAVLALMALVSLLGGSPKPTRAAAYAAPGHAFTITVPAGWTALRGTALTRLPGSPAAVLERADKRGIVIIRRTPALGGSLRTVARDLTAELRRRLPGFRLVSARLGRVRAGGAFLYSFARAGGGAAQSLGVTKVGAVTYRIDSIVAGTAPDAARQAGAIVGSFGP